MLESLVVMGKLESAFTPDAANKPTKNNPHPSTALGIWQFLASTRSYLIKKYGLGPFVADRSQPQRSFESQARVALAYLNDYLPHLKKWVPSGDAGRILGPSTPDNLVKRIYWVWGNGYSNKLLSKDHLITLAKVDKLRALAPPEIAAITRTANPSNLATINARSEPQIRAAVARTPVTITRLDPKLGQLVTEAPLLQPREVFRPALASNAAVPALVQLPVPTDFPASSPVPDSIPGGSVWDEIARRMLI